MFTPHNYFGPSPVGSMGLAENPFFPVEDGEEDIDNMSMESLEGLLPSLDSVDVTTPGWHSAAIMPDAVTSVGPNDTGVTTAAVAGTTVPAYSPFTALGTSMGTGLAKKPPALDLSTHKEKCPPTFPSEHEMLGEVVKPSPVVLPVTQAGLFATPTPGTTDKKILTDVGKKASKPVPHKAVQIKKKKSMSMANKIIKRRPRQSWTANEDKQLRTLLEQGMSDFGKIAGHFQSPFRTAKQCRDRWHNYLRPGIKKGGWTKEEEDMIMALHDKYGGRWTIMANKLKNRAENDLKNKWNSMMRTKKRAEFEANAGKGVGATKKLAPKSILTKKASLEANDKPAPRKVHFSTANAEETSFSIDSVQQNPAILTIAAAEGEQTTSSLSQATQTLFVQVSTEMQAGNNTATHQEEKKESGNGNDASIPKAAATEPSASS